MLKQILVLAGFFLVLAGPLHAPVLAQGMDTVTQNKIRVKYHNATSFYDRKEYTKALERIADIEALAGGVKLATAQNLKVKILIGLERYNEAERELELLYGMQPSNAIIAEITDYSEVIDAKIKEAAAAKEAAAEAERQKYITTPARVREMHTAQLSRKVKLDEEYKDYQAMLADPIVAQFGTFKNYDTLVSFGNNELYYGLGTHDTQSCRNKLSGYGDEICYYDRNYRANWYANTLGPFMKKLQKQDTSLKVGASIYKVEEENLVEMCKFTLGTEYHSDDICTGYLSK